MVSATTINDSRAHSPFIHLGIDGISLRCVALEDDMISKIIDSLGGVGNIREVSNCMTRLRIVVGSESLVDEDALTALDDVLGLVHDRTRCYEVVVGPGKSRKYADQCRELGIGAPSHSKDAFHPHEGAISHPEGATPKESLRRVFKTLADIFVPLIPGIVAAGLCQGFAGLIAQLVPNYQDSAAWLLSYQMLSLVGAAFIPFLSAWVGYRAAERFGATPILGGIIGMITTLGNINEIAVTLGMYNEEAPLASMLYAGRGGVLAAVVGVLFLAQVEKKIRSKMPDSLDIVATPLLSIAISAVFYVLIVMPLLGLVSSGISTALSLICMSDNAAVRMAAGFLGAALFLPLVAAGMHHGLVALYSIQLAELGYVTLYPALAMAGAGQVGAAAALWIKARRTGNKELSKVIAGALPAGVLGVGEPLVYGVTLPLGRPFITAGIGAGFGGAFVMLMQVAATSWGPSGVLATFLMTAGPNGSLSNMLSYLGGLLISCAMGCLITWVFCRLDPQETERSGAEGGPMDVAALAPTSAPGRHVSIRHGAPLFPDSAPGASFSYLISSETGIHARPAAKLVGLSRQFDCTVRIRTEEREAAADSIISIMSLGAKKGTLVCVEADGPDSLAALQEIRRFFEAEL